MSDSLFQSGGPHNIKKTARGEFSMSIELPVDEDGLIGRECPTPDCSPAYYKIKLGTGIIEHQVEAFCPYCRHAADPSDFHTRAQIEYAKNLVMRKAHKGINRMIEKSLGLGPSRRKKYDGGFLSLELSYKPGRLPHVPRPIEEELRRDLVCPHCGLVHAVFGLATWCPDCGKDIFLTHVSEELAVVERMLGDVQRRRELLGPRVAARDVENALEDTVSIFEAVLRAITRRHLLSTGKSTEDVEEILKKRVGNRYQNVEQAADICRALLGVELFEGVDGHAVSELRLTFEKRHPITHNLGIVDRKYLDKVRSGGLEGRDVLVTTGEIASAIELSRRVISNLHNRLFST
jgi:predicted  nucleic acid-binding Zn-ribbon protein